MVRTFDNLPDSVNHDVHYELDKVIVDTLVITDNVEEMYDPKLFHKHVQ